MKTKPTKKETKVVLDTNFLVLPQTKKIDIFKQIKQKKPRAKFIVLKSIQKELKEMNTKASKVAQQLIKQKNIEIDTIKTDKTHTDDKIIEYAKKKNAEVATNDKELKKRCQEKQIPVIYLRSNKKIET